MKDTVSLERRMGEELERRRAGGLLRGLRDNSSLIDFSSNDYLGFASLGLNLADQTGKGSPTGSTASRLIRGENTWFRELEERLREFFGSPAALVFNSGYSANLGFFSCVPVRGDTVVYDERCHASIRDGLRLSPARAHKFAHNDTLDLKRRLQSAAEKHGEGSLFVVVEGLYSMDGDNPDLPEISKLCDQFGAHLIIDEAHSAGVFGTSGRGVVNETGVEEKVFARVVTFGKAFGSFGAAVLTNAITREYLINFARPFIYTTGLPPVVLESVSRSVELLAQGEGGQEELFARIETFRRSVGEETKKRLSDVRGPIQIVSVPGNDQAQRVALQLQRHGFDVRAILSPTVPAGSERLRITLHRHNSEEEVQQMVICLESVLLALKGE